MRKVLVAALFAGIVVVAAAVYGFGSMSSLPLIGNLFPSQPSPPRESVIRISSAVPGETSVVVMVITPGSDSTIQKISIIMASGGRLSENRTAVFPQNVQGDVVTVVTPGGYVLEIGDYVAVVSADGGTASTFVTRRG